MLRLLPDAWVRTTGARGRNVLHLTFDDGPHPEHTPPLLDLLARHDARATFFVIGEQAQAQPQLMRRIVDAGHRLGNHSWSHPHFDRIAPAIQSEEIERTGRLLTTFDGRTRHDFRPPRGAMDRAMMLHCIRRGQRMTYWSYDSLDYSQRPAAELIDIARRHPVREGEIILMHDDNRLSHDVLDTMIPEWKARGFRFEALPTREGNAGAHAAKDAA